MLEHPQSTPPVSAPVVAMTLCIRDEVIEYVMGYMSEDIITLNNNYERGK